MSVVCDAFHCLPSQAREELGTDPDRWVWQVLELRAYARAKAAYAGKATLDAAQRATLLADPLVQIVRDIEFEQMQAALDARRAEAGADG